MLVGTILCSSFFLRFYFFIFRERVEEGETGRETLMCERYIDWLLLARPHLGTWPTTQVCTLTGNWTHDLSVHRSALNPLSHTSQGRAIFCSSFFFFFKDFIYSFRERGREKERGRNINVWPPPTGDLVHSPCSIHWATPARAILRSSWST